MRRVPFLLTIFFVIACANANADVFRLQEQLGRNWSNEFVTFATLHSPEKQWTLLGQHGQGVPFQWVSKPGDRQHRIGFQVDLEPYAENVYRLIKQTPAGRVKTDLKIQRQGDQLQIQNSKVGIALRTVATEDLGPIAGIKLNSGEWIGDSRLMTDQPIKSWNVRVTAKGPVYAEATVDIKFSGGAEWTTLVRVYADEPVVLIDEQFIGAKRATFQLRFDRNFDAQSLFYKLGKSSPAGRVGTNAKSPIKPGLVFQLEPWLRWWEAERRGAAFSIYNDTQNDLLTISARNAGVWVDPSIPVAKRIAPLVSLMKDDAGLHADFTLADGARSWMIGSHDREQSLSVMKDKATKLQSPIPYQYLIKHGHFPLETINSYQLDWESNVQHPRLLVTQENIASFRSGVTEPEVYEKRAKRFADFPVTLTESSLDDAIPAFVVSGDERLGEQLADMSERLIDRWLATLIDQNGLPYGAAPHNQSIIATGIGLADFMFGSKYLSDQRRRRLRAKLAFLGYTLTRPEYWSVPRGYAANPNMTTVVHGYRVAIACILGDHPKSTVWANESLAELLNQLNQWSDTGGGWLEAPHYAVVSYDQILGALLMAHNTGLSNALFDQPKVKKVARWLAAINTPPDSRIGGYRHHPAIGHTYVNEPCGDFGLLATLFRQRDPQFSAEMQWQFNQNNQYGAAGVGGFFHAFAGFRKLLTDAKLPAKQPRYSSELFPETGVVLRDQYGTDRETYLHMILGRHHEHYDDDSGSIVLYGKGRALIDEFGYGGYAPVADHSMIQCAEIEGSVMEPGLFTTSSRFDYVEGRKQAWHRQIVMVKGASADEPAYFVINDTIAAEQAVTWRAWMTATEVRVVSPTSVQVIGNEDVDMDIAIFSPHKLTISVENKTRRASSAMHPNWTWKAIETKQIGLIAESKAGGGVHRISAVLFPRLKTSRSPEITLYASGNAFKVTHQDGTDDVFLSNAPFKHSGREISFQGRAGVVQRRRGQPVLKLAGRGKITAGGKTLVQPAN